MKVWHKIIAFVAIFSFAFYWLRVGKYLNIRILVADLGGLPWLYASLVTIFSIIAAFCIQKEWEQWNTLNDEVKAEVSSIRELWLWAQHFPADIRSHFHDGIKKYLASVITAEWNEARTGEKSNATDPALTELYSGMFEIFKTKPELVGTSFSLFTEFLRHRASRINFASRRMPRVLHNILVFAVSLVIVLSLFIAVKDIWLDYIFTLGIATLAFAIYLVIDDLDHPIEPGGWHLAPRDYEQLLKRLGG